MESHNSAGGAVVHVDGNEALVQMDENGIANGLTRFDALGGQTCLVDGPALQNIISCHQPLPNTDFFFPVGDTHSDGIDRAAVQRCLTLDNFDIVSCLPPQSPVTVEIPFLGVLLSKTEESGKLELSTTDLTPLRLPPAPPMDPVMFDFPDNVIIPIENEERSTVLDPFSNDWNDTRLKFESKPEPVTQHEPKASPHATYPNASMLNAKAPHEVFRIFRASSADIVEKMSSDWSRFRGETMAVGERISKLLSDRGIRLKRRKRMGAEVPATEKKAIRAQRNRERSQALRRHHKHRLGSLEGACQELEVENGAARSMIQCLLEQEGGEQLLQQYVISSERGQELAQFLGQL